MKTTVYIVLAVALTLVGLNLLALTPITFYTTHSQDLVMNFPDVVASAREYSAAFEYLFPFGTAETQAVRLEHLEGRHALLNLWAVFVLVFGIAFSFLIMLVAILFLATSLVEVVLSLVVVVITAIFMPIVLIALYFVGLFNGASEAYYWIWGLGALPVLAAGLSGFVANPSHIVIIIIIKGV